LDDEDRYHNCLLLRVACECFAVRVHSFVSTTTRTCLSQWTRPAWGLQWLSGQLYVQAFIVRHQSRGTLWGLLMSCSVHAERYVLKVLSCIKLNSMCARLVALPNECRW